MSRTFLELSTEVLGGDLDDDSRGRILFVRGIAYHYLKNRDQALADAGEALMLLSLSTPHSYFLETLAFLGCFLQGGEELRYEEFALTYLERFRDRLKGLKEWNDVRNRLRWVEGQVHDRLGHPRRARRLLEKARRALLRRAPQHWVLAIAVDEALTHARHYHDASTRSIRRIVLWCEQQLQLDDELRRGLGMLARQLGEDAECAEFNLAQFRRSFTVPVPGLRATLLVPPETPPATD